MIKKSRKGTISLSFGFIFAIILIVAVIGVAFYAISYFLNLSKMTNIALFYDEFQAEIDSAWGSEITSDVFIGTLPSSIDSVCIGTLSQGTGKEREVLSRYSRADANTYLYPPNEAGDLIYKKIQHIDTTEIGWHCFPVEKGKVRIGIEKGTSDSLVKIVEQ